MSSKKKKKSDAPSPQEVLAVVLDDLRANVPGFRGGFYADPAVKAMVDYPKFALPIPHMNRLTGGGVPGGKWTTIYGKEKTGKTSLCGQIIATDHEAEPTGMWAWFDVENSFDAAYHAQFGVDLDRLVVVPAGMIMEDQMDAIISLGKQGILRGFVVDSMGSYVAVQELMTKKGVERGMREDTVTAVARKLSEFLRKSTPQIARFKMAQILIGHLYQDINPSNPRAGMVQKGGNAVKHWAHLRLVLRRANDKDLKRAVIQPDGQTKECYVGFTSIIRVDKTRQSATEGQEVEVPFIYGVGFDSVEATLRTALALGIIQTAGAWYKHPLFPGDKCQIQGKQNAKQFVRENPSVMAKISDQVLSHTDEAFGLKATSDAL